MTPARRSPTRGAPRSSSCTTAQRRGRSPTASSILLDGRPAAHGPVRDVLEAPPTPAVAAFVGFSGTLHEPDGTLRMLKPGHAALDPAGDIAATVARRVPVEDGVRLELTLPNGRVHALAPLPGPQPGDTVRVTLAAGITYPPTAPRSPSGAP